MAVWDIKVASPSMPSLILFPSAFQVMLHQSAMLCTFIFNDLLEREQADLLMNDSSLGISLAATDFSLNCIQGHQVIGFD